MEASTPKFTKSATQISSSWVQKDSCDSNGLVGVYHILQIFCNFQSQSACMFKHMILETLSKASIFCSQSFAQDHKKMMSNITQFSKGGSIENIKEFKILVKIEHKVITKCVIKYNM